MIPEEKPIKLAQVAELLNTSRRTVCRWVAEEGLPAYRPGRGYLFYWSEVKAWLESTKNESNNDDSGKGNPT